jgi:hypothetical protein
VEIAAPPPKYPLRSRMRFDFERALLEAAQDRAIREAGGAAAVAPWRKPGAKWWFLRKVAVPGFRLMPWGIRRKMMRTVCGYPDGWPKAP